MTDGNGFIVKNVAYVVDSAMHRIGAKLEDTPWFQQIALEWLTEDARGVTALPCLRVQHLTVSTSKQVKLPSDCLRYTKIAVDYGGKLWTLTLNDDITIPPNFPCCNTTDSSATNEGVTFMPHFWGGQYYGGIFALGGGFNKAYYRIDWQTNTLTFLDDVFGRKIIIEYLSNGAGSDVDSLVPQFWIPPMREYLILKAAEYNRKDYPQINMNVQDQRYNDAIMNASIASGPTADELLDAYYSAPGLTLR